MDLAEWSAELTTLQSGPDPRVAALGPDGKYGLMRLKPDAGASLQLFEAATGARIGGPLSASGRWSFSPDGRTLLLASGQEVQVLAAATGKPRCPPLGQPDCTAFHWSADGRKALVASKTRLRLWDLDQGKPLGEPVPKDEDGVVAFQPRSLLAAVSDRAAKSVQLWNTAAGTPVAEPLKVNLLSMSRMEFSPDGAVLVLVGGSRRGSQAQFWDVHARRPIGSPLEGPFSSEVVCAFSPDGKLLAASQHPELIPESRPSTTVVRLYDTSSAEPVSAPMLHPDQVTAIRFSPSGKLLLAVANPYDEGPRRPRKPAGQARLWTVPAGVPIGTLEHRGRVHQAAFSADSKLVVTASADHTARLWDSATARPLSDPLPHPGGAHQDSSFPWTSPLGRVFRGALPEHSGEVLDAGFSPDGRSIVTCTVAGVRLWDRSPGKVAVQQADPNHFPLTDDCDVALIQDASDSSVIRLWDVATGKPLGQPIFEPGTRLHVQISPDRETVLTVTEQRLCLWKTATGEPVGQRLQERSGPPGPNIVVFASASVAFSPDGRTLATVAGSNKVRLWDTRTGDLLLELTPQSSPQPLPISALAISPDGKALLTTCADRFNTRIEYRLWETATGKPIGERWIKEGSDFPRAAFAPDSRHVVTGTDADDREIQFRETATARPVGEPLRSPVPVLFLRFSPDGKRVLALGSDKLCLGEVPTGKPVGKEIETTSPLLVAISPDSSTLATITTVEGRKGVVRQWDLATGEARGDPLAHTDPIQAVHYTAGSKSLLTVSGTEARLWDAQTGKRLADPPRRLVIGLEPGQPFNPMTIFREDGTVLQMSPQGFSLWDLSTDKTVYPPVKAPGIRLDVLNNPARSDARTVITLTTESRTTLTLWDPVHNEPLGKPIQVPGKRQPLRVKTLNSAKKPASGCNVLSPDRRVFVTPHDPRTLVLYDALSGTPMGQPLVHPGTVLDAAFSPDSNLLLTVGSTARDGSYFVRLWRVGTGSLVAELMPATNLFSPDSRTLLAARPGPPGEVRLYDTGTGKLRGEPLPLPERPSTIAFSPDGKRFAIVGSKDVRLWETATRQLVGEPLTHPAMIQGLVFSPDGSRLLCYGGKQAWLWDLAAGKLAGPVIEEALNITAALFGPDGKGLLLGSVWLEARPFGIPPGFVRLRDGRTGEPLTGSLNHPHAVREMVFRPDGRYFLTVDQDGVLRVWEAGRDRPLCASPPYQGGYSPLSIQFEQDWSVTTAYMGEGRRSWRLPVPVEGSSERLRSWVEERTGMELDDEGVIRVLDVPAREQRRARLKEWGGPSLP
jgi:WD40 repeat protein